MIARPQPPDTPEPRSTKGTTRKTSATAAGVLSLSLATPADHSGLSLCALNSPTQSLCLSLRRCFFRVGTGVLHLWSLTHSAAKKLVISRLHTQGRRRGTRHRAAQKKTSSACFALLSVCPFWDRDNSGRGGAKGRCLKRAALSVGLPLGQQAFCPLRPYLSVSPDRVETALGRAGLRAPSGVPDRVGSRCTGAVGALWCRLQAGYPAG